MGICVIRYPFFVFVIFGLFARILPKISDFLAKNASFYCFLKIYLAVMKILTLS